MHVCSDTLMLSHVSRQGPGACTFTGFLPVVPNVNVGILPVVSNVNVGISSEGVISINLLPL